MVCAQEGGDLLGLDGGIRLTLLLATLLLEFLQSMIFIADIEFLLIKCIYQLPEIHDGGGRLVNIPQLF